ncbi:hypothetical protein [Micromonospora sp. CPCC 206061]|uniref:hypothetical protein n=1 Tax=Micromonospora sp. CPCC 206061 TaxID=3122410 RepID=UPI002FF2A348
MASLPILVAIGAGTPTDVGRAAGSGAPESAMPFIALPPTGPVIVSPAPTPSAEPPAVGAAPGVVADRRSGDRHRRRSGDNGRRSDGSRPPARPVAPTESGPAPRPPVPTSPPPEPTSPPPVPTSPPPKPTQPPSHPPTSWWPPVPHPTLPQLPRPPRPPSHVPPWPVEPVWPAFVVPAG